MVSVKSLIQKHSYFPKYSGVIFIVLFVIISFIYNYQHILFNPPQSLHMWRQCDCLSITLNYYQDNNPFLEPALHNLGEDGTGKSMSECPLVYFLMAKIWKAFGYHVFLYRLFVLLLFLTGLFALFKLFESCTRDSVVSMLFVLLLFTSPTLVYYANNFLMDIPALSLAMAGLYFFFRFEQTAKNKFLYRSAFFYVIAGLLKISSLLTFFAIIGLFILEIFKVKLYPNRKLFKYPIKQGAVFLGVILIQMAWYLYAHQYNSNHNPGNFLIGILPVWKMSPELISATFNAIIEHIKWDYFRMETQVVFMLMFLSILFYYKKINKLWLIFTIISAAGFLAFLILFFEPLKDHDYYTINLFILVPIIMISFLTLLKNKFNFIYTSLIFMIILVAFLIHNIDFARRRISDRYHPEKWQNNYYSTCLKSFEEINPYLKSIGIKKEDKVLSLSDNSINISLYMMNQKGWTNYRVDCDPTIITQKIRQGARYLFISDTATYKNRGLEPFLTNKAGTFNNIDIYRLDQGSSMD